MTNLVNNINPRKNPKTNLIGYGFLILSIILTILNSIEIPYINIDWYSPIITVFIGLGLIISPDKLFIGLRDMINKIIDLKVK